MNILFRPLCYISFFLCLFPLLVLYAQLTAYSGSDLFSIRIMEIIREHSYLQSFRNSAIIGFATACVSGFFGVLQAILLQRSTVRGRKLFLFLYFIPFLIPTYIHAIAWSNLFTGQLNGSIFYHAFYGLSGVIAILSVAYIPLVTAIVMVGLNGLDREREEAALMHSSPFRVLFRITLPGLYPHITGGILLVMVLAMANFDVPDLLRVRVIPVEIFIQLSAMYDETGALLLALPYIVLPFLIVLLLGKKSGVRQATAMSGGRGNATTTNSMHGNWILYILFFILCISLMIPLASLIYSSALERLWSIMMDSFDEFSYSFLLALCTAVFTVFCAIPFSYLLARNHPLKSFFSAIVLLPFVTPGLFIGLSMIKVGNMSLFYPLNSTSLLCLLALVSHFLFLSVKIIQSGMEQVSVELEQVAAMHGTAKVKIISAILFPQLHGVLLSSFFIVFVCAFGELSTTLLLVPPGRESIAAKMYNVMHYGANDILSTLCLITILILFSLGVLVILCQKIVVKYSSKFVSSIFNMA